MNVMHVITGLGQGGAESVLYRLISACKDPSKHYVISLRDDGVFGERLRAIGVTVYSLSLGGVGGLVRGVARLRELMRRVSPDVVQTWMYHADLIGGLAARLENIPVCWGLHNSNFERKYTKLLTRVVVKMCSYFSNSIPVCIVSCSKVARDLHVGVGYAEGKFSIIPNGLSLSEFQSNPEAGRGFRKSIRISDGDRVFVNVARFHPQKDHANLLRAFDAAFCSDRSVHLVLCGLGMVQDNPEIAGLLAGSRVSDRVHLLGPRSDVPRVLAGADYFVLSSVGEAFPCVVAEAMACEVPCVVTDVGDCAEIVGETGWVVPPLNSTELAAALKDAAALSSSRRYERAVRARQLVMANYGIDRMVGEYEKVWGLAIKSKGEYSLS